MDNTEFIWVEKWRPKRIADCILPDKQKKVFKEMIDCGDLQNMLFCGSAGVGKTTVAKALCDEMDLDSLFINASLENGIDVLRTKISQFASSVSFTGRTKVVILDEADYTNPQSFQPALRGFIEEFSQNCRFIFTCNFKNRIIPPLHSRCSVIEFKIDKTEKPKVAAAFFRRIMEILAHEKVEADQKVVAKIIEKHFPDYRRILNELQKYSSSGKIDEGILVNLGEVNMTELVESLRSKDFKKMRNWVVNNLDNDPSSLFRKIYDTLLDQVNQVPQLVLLLADYQYKAAFVADPEINLVACLTEIMATIEIKK